MRNDLNGLTQVVAPAFLIQNVLVDAPRTDRIGLARSHAGEPFVMAQIQIGFRPVIGHEHFAMFKR